MYSAQSRPGSQPETAMPASPLLVQVPLFPLDTVLFSGGRLSLRLYEPRYLDMLVDCLKRNTGFAVVLTRQQEEQSKERQAPGIFTVGTYARVVDFDALDDGTLGIDCQGESKLRVLRTERQADGLLLGLVEFLPEERPQALTPEHAPLLEILRELMQHPLVQKMAPQVNFDDARSVSWRLAELLPLEPEIKQGLLQMHLPRERLTELARLVHNLRS